MAVVLLVVRKDFRVGTDPPSWLSALKFVPAYFALVFAVGFIALFTQRQTISPSLTIWNSFQTIVLGLIGVHGPYTYDPDSSFGTAFPVMMLSMGIIGLVIFAFLAFRGPRSTSPPSSTASRPSSCTTSSRTA